MPRIGPLRSSVEALAATTATFVAMADGSQERPYGAATSPPTRDLRGDITAMAMYARTTVSSVRQTQLCR